jgi:transposase
MLGAAMYTTIKTLWEQGYNKSEISRLTGHDWKTISKVINAIKSGQETPVKKPHPRVLDKHKEKIMEWIEEGLTGVRIREELIRSGQPIGKTTVHDYIRLIKQRYDIFVRIHTKPGEEAQVDFGYAGYTLDNNGKRRKTWVFNMRLSFSRYDYYEKVYDQKVETFIQCHINAFTFFGGVPQAVKIDNLKAAVLEAHFYEPLYQTLYKSFADHYGFKPLPCRIYRPNDKGNVESGIKYVKKNFFLGRKFKDGDDLDRHLRQWLDRVCNCRVHGTTRKIPKDEFMNEEKQELRSLPVSEFKLSQMGRRKVYHDCHVYVNYSYYSVPFEYVGKWVTIEKGQGIVKIYDDDTQIAIHPELKSRGEFSTNSSHYPKYKRMSDTEFQEKYQLKMAGIGNYVEQMFFYILKHQKHYWQRSVQGILSLSKKHPPNVIDLSCKRALAFHVCSYRTIKNICENGSYKLPVEFQEGTSYEHH